MSSSAASNESTQASVVEPREVEENLSAPLWKYVTKHEKMQLEEEMSRLHVIFVKKLQGILF
jgi:hypothetical protein